jgi:hypothetical protein
VLDNMNGSVVVRRKSRVVTVSFDQFHQSILSFTDQVTGGPSPVCHDSAVVSGGELCYRCWDCGVYGGK